MARPWGADAGTGPPSLVIVCPPRRIINPGQHRRVLNCAIPLARVKALSDFAMTEGWNLDKSLIASVGFGAKLPPALETWSYTPKIQALKQLPQFKALPQEHSTLMRSPWFQSPSQALGLGINARYLRHHHQLWNDLRSKILRGVFTTLVYVTPQSGFSLTPHIKLDRVLRYPGSLNRCAGPTQLFTATHDEKHDNQRNYDRNRLS